MSFAPVAEEAKALGVYYTDSQVADFLAWWALRLPTDTVLDPCFGGGVFLRSGCKRLLQLGGDPTRQVFAIEVDREVHQRISDKLADEYSVPRQHLLLADFFNIDPASAEKIDAAIGNPPFIRYQRFTGPARKLALTRSLAQGVRLPELCSSWAPFLVHTIAMLKPGGRLAMVLPMEVAHAKYARPVLEFARRSFGSATFLTFRKKLFPDLSEDTVLLLAAERGAPSSQFLWRELDHPGMLWKLREDDRWPLSGTQKIDGEAIASGASRLIEYFIPAKARELYQELKRSSHVARLGMLADVGIGYVTGANDFFHLAPLEAGRRKIPREFLKPAVRRGRALSGLRFNSEDWEVAAARGEAGYLLHIGKGLGLPSSVRDYLDDGEAQGIDQAYKCRMRSPWFAVPHVHRPDAFLTYMSGAVPKLVANHVGAFAPNSLHVLRIHPLVQMPSDVLAALWQTSLTLLSGEIEGHALGGGMLKLEPTEAESVLVASPERSEFSRLLALAGELDALTRYESSQAARDRADEAILQRVVGLSKSDCNLLREAASTLRGRRGYKDTVSGLT